MTRSQKGLVTFSGATLALVMFTTPVKINAQENPLRVVAERQQDDRERFKQAHRQALDELARVEKRLEYVTRDRSLWRLFWLRKAHTERRWRRDYVDMLQRQERERRRLAERIARGEVR